MELRLWTTLGLVTFLGLVFMADGVIRKLNYQIITGIAMIVVAAWGPIIAAPRLGGWVAAAAVIPPALAAAVMRYLPRYMGR